MKTRMLALFTVTLSVCNAFRFNPSLSSRSVRLYQATTEYPSASSHGRSDELFTAGESTGLQALGEQTIESPKKIRIGSQPVIAVEGDSTETTLGQQATLSAHFLMFFLKFRQLFNNVVTSRTCFSSF